MAENNRPIYKYQLGTVECAVWAKQASDWKPYFQFTFQKTYKSKDGKYMHSTSFNKSDLPLLSTVCQRACLAEIAKQSIDIRTEQATHSEEVKQVSKAVGGRENLEETIIDDEPLPF